MPPYLKNKKNIICLTKDKRTGAFYTDNLCLFRCLALFNGFTTKNLERVTKHYLETWCRTKQISPDKFPGVHLKELATFEHLFGVNVNCYSMSEDEHVTCLYHTCGKHSANEGSRMNVHLFKSHFSYITKFDGFAKKFRCALCSMTFAQAGNYQRHMKSCTKITKDVFTGGLLKSPKTVFDELAELGIWVEPQKRFNPHFGVFDIETCLERQDSDEATKLRLTRRHKPVSVALASNVESYENCHCIIDAEPKSLVAKMLQHLGDIQSKAEALMTEELERLRELSQEWGQMFGVVETDMDSEDVNNDLTENDCGNDNDDDDDEHGETDGEMTDEVEGVALNKRLRHFHSQRALKHIAKVKKKISKLVRPSTCSWL